MHEFLQCVTILRQNPEGVLMRRVQLFSKQAVAVIARRLSFREATIYFYPIEIEIHISVQSSTYRRTAWRMVTLAEEDMGHAVNGNLKFFGNPDDYFRYHEENYHAAFSNFPADNGGFLIFMF